MRRPVPGDYCKKPVINRNTRRDDSHDYRKPWIYLITASIYPGRPSLCEIEGSIQTPTVRYTLLGEKIKDEILRIPHFHNELAIYSFVIMPDHIHFIVHVQRELSKPLGCLLSGFFGACSKHYKEIYHLSELKTLFQRFHDRPLRHRAQLECMKRYVVDNPRRYLIKRFKPELFRSNMLLALEDNTYQLYGNIFLLRSFDKELVIIHRADDSETRMQNELRWMACASSGGVLVSPFISKAEKAIRDKGIEAGASLIIVCKADLSGRFKPSGRDFEMCAQGRLLMIAPVVNGEASRTKALTRKEALEMNRIASLIVDLNEKTDYKIVSTSLK